MDRYQDFGIGVTPVEIIAEPGATHGGDLGAMLALMRAAAEAGATAFKNQWLSDPSALVARRRAARYAESYARLGYPEVWHRACAKEARTLGIRYGCSVYLPGDAERVAPFVNFVKVSSFEAQTAILDEALATGRPTVVSSGMLNTSEALVVAKDLGPRDALLHCISAYPTRPEEMNLAAIADLKSRGVYCAVGFSDHSALVDAGAYAVMAGAEVVEVHCSLPDATGPDVEVAFVPEILARYVAAIRRAEVMRGEPRKSVQPGEAPMLAYRPVGRR